MENTRGIRRLSRCRYVIPALLAMQVAGVAAAQEPDPVVETREMLATMSTEAVDPRAAELLEEISGNMESFKRYESRLAAASEEDAQVLRLQIDSVQLQTLHQVHELAALLETADDGSADPELRGRVADLMSRIAPRILQQAQRLRSEIDGLRASRSSAPVGERPAIEDSVARLTGQLDTVYRESLDHLEEMERLGLDVAQHRAALADSLLDRADELSGRLELALVRIEDLEGRLKDTPDHPDLPALRTAARKSLDTISESLGVTLDLMDALDLETDRYREQLVMATRDISSGLTDTRVASSLVSRGVAAVIGWLGQRGPGLLFKTLLFAGILLAFRVLARLVRGAVARALEASTLDLSQLLKKMIVTWTYNLIWLFGLLIALSQLGISLGPLLAGLGVAGFIVGFALQSTLSNFAAGLMILLYRPFDVGDLVDVGGAFGKVEAMSLVSTSILTLDHQKLVVPNSMIWGDVIKNVTAQDVRRIDMVFGISYTDDIPHAERVLEDILRNHERVLSDPEPVVRLHTLGESSVDFVVRPWVTTEDYWEVYWDVTREVKMRFDAEGISIPFPQRDVHLYPTGTEMRFEAG